MTTILGLGVGRGGDRARPWQKGQTVGRCRRGLKPSSVSSELRRQKIASLMAGGGRSNVLSLPGSRG
jgi:hypothetical protein